MTTGNSSSKPESVFVENGVEYIAMKNALEFLDITASTFFVAAKRHADLKAAVETKVKDPRTGATYSRIKWSAVEHYAANRKSGGSNGDHPGQFKYTGWLAEDELERAAKAVSKALGREFTFERLYKGKSKDEGAADETEA